MEEYIRVKERIFENMGQGDYAVLNLDDPIVRGMAERIPCAPAFFSRRQEVKTGAYLEGEEVVFFPEWAQEARPARGRDPHPRRAQPGKRPGRHGAAMLAGVPAPVVRHTLKTFPGVEHRIETVRTVEGVTYINDSKGTNVDASIRAVRAMKVPTVLLAGGYDKHTDFLPLAREILASKIHTVVVLGDTAEQIERALRAVGFESILHAKTFEEAVLLARSCAREGENVLLSPACASFDMFQDYEERGRVFKEIVSRL